MDGMKCGREQCSCFVDLGEVYCGENCAAKGEADQGDPHGICGCRHTDCDAPQ